MSRPNKRTQRLGAGHELHMVRLNRRIARLQSKRRGDFKSQLRQAKKNVPLALRAKVNWSDLARLAGSDDE